MTLTHKEIRMMRRRQKMQNQPPKEPNTEKEILDRIHELDYRRIMLSHIRHPQLPSVQENIANEIKRLYGKLEDLKKQERKENAPNV
jgi:hypothetical protein